MGRGAARRAAYIALFRLVRTWEFSNSEVNTEWWLVLSHLARLSLRVWLLVMGAKGWVEEVESDLGSDLHQRGCAVRRSHKALWRPHTLVCISWESDHVDRHLPFLPYQLPAGR